MALKIRLLKKCILVAVIISVIQFIMILFTLTESAPHIFLTTTGYGLQYGWKNKAGKPFVLSKQLNVSLSAVGYPLTDYVNVLGDAGTILSDFVFATAVSRSHVPYVLDGIATIQQQFPGKKIILYNIGAEGDEQIEQVIKKCTVTIKSKF